MAETQTPDHHGSHRRLIWPADESTRRGRVDAIIVPTVRPLEYLQDAAVAARFLGCPLVTLHSPGRTRASAAAFNLDFWSLHLIAIDVPGPAHLRLPELKTSELLKGTIFERRTDVSTKRNLGLLLSHMLHWKRVVFLDDDIRVPHQADLAKAASLLGTHAAVALGIDGFPDNSVVCHAFREAGGSQDTFIGGGALAIDLERNFSFFPNIYNEDWFFVLDAAKGLQSVATVGRVIQDKYDPYLPERARAEEFGDVLAEGTFWLLDQGRSASDGDLAHWRNFLAKRKRFIEQVLSMVERTTGPESAERQRKAEALNAALGRLAEITPELCVDYMQALVTDQERWQAHIQAIRRQPKLSQEEALGSLTDGGGTRFWHTRKPSSRHRRRTQSRFRQVQKGELEAAIPPPPPALAPRVFTTAWRRALPLLGALPLLVRLGGSSSHAAHALVATDVALASQECQAEGDDHNDKCPSQ